jgi:Tol biopolymer transport system component
LAASFDEALLAKHHGVWHAWDMSRALPSSFFVLFAALSLLSTHARAEEIESKLLSGVRQLIFEGRRSGEGYFAPDGKKLIFQSEREEGNPFYQMYVLDLESGETSRVSPGIGKTTCGFFQPGNSRVLFASTHHDPGAEEKQKAELEFRASGKERRYSWDYDPAMDVFSADENGKDLQRLTTAEGYDAEAAYSPDGKQIVFSSLRSAYEQPLSPEDRARMEKDPAWFGEIYIMDADGSNQRRLTNTRGYDGGPFFSPDGERIIWRRFDEKGMHADVFTMKTDGSDVRRLTAFGSMSWAPYLHPTGQYAVFTSNKLGFENFELFIVDAAGEHEPVRVTYTDGFDGLPVFSPDGKRLSWTSNRTSDRKSQIFLGEWNHPAALKALQDSPKRTRTPAELEAEEAGGTPLRSGSPRGSKSFRPYRRRLRRQDRFRITQN